MLQKKIISFIAVLLCFFLLFSGCTNFLFNRTTDRIVQQATPYIQKIVMNNLTLRIYANSLIRNCSSDKECQISALYRSIVEHYNYVSDPTGKELIQSPFETMAIQGGDCEDLTILYMSLLENIGIKTYLVMTENHTYCLVADVDTTILQKYNEQTLLQQLEKDNRETIRQFYHGSFVLNGRESWYYGGNGSSFENDSSIDYMNISYNIVSDSPVDFYVVPSREDFNLFNEREPFTSFPAFTQTYILTLNNTCPYLNTTGGIILHNSHFKEAAVQVHLNFYYHPSFTKIFKNYSITSYQLDNTTCIAVDPTAGVYGYPGFSSNLTKETYAIDPVTKEYFVLH